MVVPYSKFGTADETLYRQYLLACVVGENGQNIQSCGGDERTAGRKLGRGAGGSLGGVGAQAGGVVDQRRRWLDANGFAELLRFYGSGAGATGGHRREWSGEKKVLEEGIVADNECSGQRGATHGGEHGLRGDVGDSGVATEVVSEQVESVVRGKRYAENRRKKEKRRETKAQQTSRGEESVAGSVQTVDTRTGVEIEAAQTLAARRVAENKVKIAEAKVAAKLAEHRLKALSDKERSIVIDRLAAARLEEKINTSRKNSQASFKECGSPIDSVGSALSAHEFAFKQQVRQIDAEKKKVAYMKVQLDRYYAYSPDYVNQIIAEIPEPHIPTEQEMEEEDSDQSPFLSNDEMWEEANKYQHG